MHDTRVAVASTRQFADQRLQDVVQGHQPFEITVFIDHERQRLAGGYLFVAF